MAILKELRDVGVRKMEINNISGNVPYVAILPIKNKIIDRFVSKFEIGNLPTPINILFWDNYILNLKRFKNVFRDFNMGNNVFYSCKANKGYSFMYGAASEGCGIEVSSIYELKDALKYTNKIIASGPAKSMDYLKCAIVNHVIISLDDIEELRTIIDMRMCVEVLIRISDIIGMESRFGINQLQIDECLTLIAGSRVTLIGFSFHINNYKLEDRIAGIYELLKIVHEKNIIIKYIDIGGGMPVKYCESTKFQSFLELNNSDMYFKKKIISDFYPYSSAISDADGVRYILEKIKNSLEGIEIIVEPGRSLLNNCGISIFEVVYLKKFPSGENLIVTNGNINCLSEQWFGSDYVIEPQLLKKNKTAPECILFASVAGNLCLEKDMITWRKIKFNHLPEKGDCLVYFNTAGYQMDSNESCFHKIPLVSKVVATKKNGRFIIRRDEEYDCK